MIKLFSSILLGFLRNPKLGSAISNDYVISRMVTCDADNLFDYQSVLTSTHTNCLIQFVKERLVKSVSSQPRRAFYAFLICCQAFILKFFTAAFFRKPTTSTTYRLPRSVDRCEEANNTRFEFRVNTLFQKLFSAVSPAPRQLMKSPRICREPHHGAKRP